MSSNAEESLVDDEVSCEQIGRGTLVIDAETDQMTNSSSGILSQLACLSKLFILIVIRSRLRHVYATVVMIGH